eukprot:214916_1
MASFFLMLLYTLSCICYIIKAESGCSDYDCACHPDEQCSPSYATNSSCHSDPNGCFGPVIGTLFQIAVNKSIAESLLPDGLQLGTIPNYNDTNSWPIAFMFAQQQNVGNWNYLEFILLITYIEWNDTLAKNYKYKGPYGYGPKLYLDLLGPTEAGQICGVDKTLANVTQNCDMNGNCKYEISTTKGENILSAEWTANGVKYENASLNENFWNYQRASFNLPSIAQYPVNKGVFQCGITNWFIDNALIQPVTGTLTIFDDFYGDIPTGTFNFDDTIDQDPYFGAYRLETMWAFEQPCSPQQETCTQFEPPNKY